MLNIGPVTLHKGRSNESARRSAIICSCTKKNGGRGPKICANNIFPDSCRSRSTDQKGTIYEGSALIGSKVITILKATLKLIFFSKNQLRNFFNRFHFFLLVIF